MFHSGTIRQVCRYLGRDCRLYEHSTKGRAIQTEFPDVLGLFRDNQGYTTISAAVAILVTLALLMGSAQLVWSSAVSADVQSVADAAALGGANVVSKYMTTATVLDASVLSMGLIGMSILASGLIVAAIPPVSEFAPPIIDAGTQTLEARSRFAKSAYAGLEKVERGLPYLVAANSIAVVKGNAQASGLPYSGVAVPFPYDGSDGSFSSYDDLLDEAQAVKESSQEVKDYSDQADQAKQQADEIKKQAWLHDCGNQGYSLYERAGKLGNLSGVYNPYYPQYENWSFAIPLARTQNYYAQRYAAETPASGSVEEEIKSIARKVYYEYAREKVAEFSVTTSADEHIHIDFEYLPRNTEELRATHIYTDARWPVTLEDKDPVLHYSLSAPGITGPFKGVASFADIDSGAIKADPLNPFTIHDIGKVPLASSSIENGYEYHWRKIVDLSKGYEEAYNRYKDLERKAKEAAEKGEGAFGEALAKLAAPRPKLTPPGRYGVVSLVGDSQTHTPPAALLPHFMPGVKVPARAGVAAATLAIDESDPKENVLSQFFENLKDHQGSAHTDTSAGTPFKKAQGIAGALLDGSFDIWGKVLTAYGNAVNNIQDAINGMFDQAQSSGGSAVSKWIAGKLTRLLDIGGLQPVDLRARKPVLVNSVDVFDKAGVDGAVKIRSFINAIPPQGSMDSPSQMATTLSGMAEDAFGTDEFEICEIPIPGTGLSIPVSVKLSEVFQDG